MAGSALRDGKRKKAFYQSVMKAGRGLDDAAAEALAEALARSTSQIWLWDEEIVDSLKTRLAGKPSPNAEGPSSAAGSDPGPDPGFDPFAFSAVVVLKKQGPAALLKRLDAIASVADLLRLADAQHIGVDRGEQDVQKLRLAILRGTEQRLADRRAAAS